MENVPSGRINFEERDVQLELLRAARLCHPHWETAGRITFDGRGMNAAAWQNWKTEVFQAVLRPQLEAAYVAAAAGNGAGLEICDAAIEAGLSAELAGRSRRAGLLLAEGFTAPAAEKCWRRTRERIIAQAMPGHLAVMVALRAAAFHLPPAMMLGSYLLLEAHGAFGVEAWPLSLEMVGDCLVGGIATAKLRAA